MIIKRLHVGNFQCFKEPVTIELAPITLLYGPNSAGKSAVADAIDAAFDVLAGNETVSTAKLKAWCHNGDTAQPIVLGLGALLFDPSDEARDLDLELKGALPGEPSPLMTQSNEDVILGAILPRPGQPENELDVIALIDASGERCSLGGVTVVVGGATLCELQSGSQTTMTIWTSHPVFQDRPGLDVGRVIKNFSESANADATAQIEVRNDSVVLTGIYASSMFPIVVDMVWDAEAYWNVENEVPRETLSELTALMRTLTVIVSRLIGSRKWLWQRIGPLRWIPKESDLYDGIVHAGIQASARTWVDGGAAWAALLTNDMVPKWGAGKKRVRDEEPLVNSVNEWIGSERHLSMGYLICHRHYVLKAKRGRTGRKSDPGFEAAPAAEAELKQVFLWDERQQRAVSPDGVGTGVSQLLPILVRLSAAGGYTFVEQPELHLHPRLQSQLADFVISKTQLAKQRDHVYICLLESHSEHIALRVLRRMRETAMSRTSRSDFALTPEDVAFYYFEPVEGKTTVHRLRVDETGRFVDQWPKGFFDERADDLFDSND